MKNVNLSGILFLFMALCLGSCKKEGPAGPQGAQGEQGVQGVQGIPGEDGSVIYSGEGVPSTDIGKAGDYYLDKNSSQLYGPKTSSGWGTGVMMRGPQGARGEKGDPGTANVMYSDWKPFSFNPSDKSTGLFDPVSQLTTKFIDDGGIVLVYLRITPTRIFPLPFTYTFYGYEFSYALGPGTIEIIEATTGSGKDITVEYSYRYMLIPGGVHVRKSSSAPDPKDYKATCKYYGIAE